MIIRTRRQRKEMRAELQPPPPANRTSTKVKTEFLDKTYKFFLQRFARNREKDGRKRFMPPEYRPDGLPVEETLKAHSLRRSQWPESLPESLSWLTDLCKLAGTYAGAWALANTEIINDIVSAFVAREGDAWHSTEGSLLVLLVALCARVKETQHKLYPHLGTYVELFAEILQQAVSHQRFILKLNSRYEFHSPALDLLVPIIHAIYTQPYIKQITHTNLIPNLSAESITMRIDLFEDYEIQAYHHYRNHLEVNQRQASQIWKDIKADHEKMDKLVEETIHYEPTIINLVWNTLSELFTDHSHYPDQKFTIKPAVGLKSALLKALMVGSGQITPRAYLLCWQLIRAGGLDADALVSLVPQLWDYFDQLLAAELDPQSNLPETQRLRSVFAGMLLTKIEPVEPPEKIIEKLRLFARQPESYRDNSTVCMRIWQMVSKTPSLISEAPTIRLHLEDAPEFVQNAYRILMGHISDNHDWDEPSESDTDQHFESDSDLTDEEEDEAEEQDSSP